MVEWKGWGVGRVWDGFGPLKDVGVCGTSFGIFVDHPDLKVWNGCVGRDWYGEGLGRCVEDVGRVCRGCVEGVGRVWEACGEAVGTAWRGGGRGKGAGRVWG
eukprot:3321465-Rhodomonas_salina.2